MFFLPLQITVFSFCFPFHIFFYTHSLTKVSANLYSCQTKVGLFNFADTEGFFSCHLNLTSISSNKIELLTLAIPFALLCTLKLLRSFIIFIILSLFMSLFFNSVSCFGFLGWVIVIVYSRADGLQPSDCSLQSLWQQDRISSVCWGKCFRFLRRVYRKIIA